MAQIKEVPVYLFLGFLESGKTKFIQETLEDPRFGQSERTLVLVFEEGEEEYRPSRFSVKKCALEVVEERGLNVRYLNSLVAKHRPERVVVEWNGMLEINRFFEAMPEGWMIAQVMTFFDSSTFLSYNKNVRQLTFDKLQFTDMVVFNRFDSSYDKEAFHKIVRGVSRRPEIVYEYADGRAEYDEIEDPLPYDVNAKIVQIEDRDFAFFYRDLMEDMQKYRGKTVRFKGLVATDRRIPQGTIVVGRHIMTCCEADIAYSGIVCMHASELPLKTRDWVMITARIDLEYHSIYEQEGPVLKATSLEYCDVPEQELATFY